MINETREGAGFQKCCGGSRCPRQRGGIRGAGALVLGAGRETRRHLREMPCTCIAHSTCNYLAIIKYLRLTG